MRGGGKIESLSSLPGADLLDRVRGQASDAWTRLRARERFLVVAVALLALATAAFTAFGWSQDQRDRYAAAQADLLLARQARLTTRGGLDGVQRAQLAALSDWTTRGRNIWMTRIDLEQAIAVAAAQAGTPDPEIQVAEAVEGDAALPLVRAEVSGPYVAGPFAAFLQALAAGDHTMVVDRVEIGDANTARYRLTLLFPIDITPERAAWPAPPR